MDLIHTKEFVTLGATLVELTVKATTTSISTKVKTHKEEQCVAKIRNAYDKIVNEVLKEHNETI